MRGEQITMHIPGEPTGERDEQGNLIISSAQDVPIRGVALAPRGADESTQTFGPKVVTGWQVYAPSGTVIPASATFTIRGVNGWQMEGEVGQWSSPFSGRGKGVEFAVRRAS